MTARFEAMKKTELVAQIAEWTKNNSGKQGVAFWRALPKETLVIVAADMLATDAERNGEPKATTSDPKLNQPSYAYAQDMSTASVIEEPADLDDGTQNPEQGATLESVNTNI